MFNTSSVLTFQLLRKTITLNKIKVSKDEINASNRHSFGCKNLFHPVVPLSPLPPPFPDAVNRNSEFYFLHILASICCSAFLITAFLTGVKWCLVVVLIFISLTTGESEHFSYIGCHLFNSFWDSPVQTPCPFLTELLSFFGCWELGFFPVPCILWILILGQKSSSPIFSPNCIGHVDCFLFFFFV